jgi:hypothetical protein
MGSSTSCCKIWINIVPQSLHRTEIIIIISSSSSSSGSSSSSSIVIVICAVKFAYEQIRNKFNYYLFIL